MNILENDAQKLNFLKRIRHYSQNGKESRKEGTAISLIIAVVLYLAFVFTLAFLTYKSFALPVANLEEAAKN